MEAIEKLSNSLNGMTMEKLFEEALNNEDFRNEVIRILIQDQLEQGIDGDGNELPEYSEISVNVYGKEPGPYKLYDTGEFYNSITIEKIDGSGIVIYGDTDKGRIDLMMYSDSILYLNNDSLNELKPMILEKFKEYLLTKMLKKS
jgi:hypothetical protein